MNCIVVLLAARHLTNCKKMSNLAVLRARQCSSNEIVELRSLKELQLHCGGSILQRIVLPKLEKLTLVKAASESEYFSALSRNAPNLQHIEIKNRDISFLHTILEHCQTIKTLLVDLCFYGKDFSFQAPSRQNLGLEELLLRKRDQLAPVGQFYDLINACPNLKRIQLLNFIVPNQQIVSVLHNSQQLKHFWFGSPTFHLGLEKYDTEINLPDPFMLEIINIFENSTAFTNLTLCNIAEGFSNRIKSLLLGNAGVIVGKFKKPRFGNCLWLLKQPCASDPFQNFHERKPEIKL